MDSILYYGIEYWLAGKDKSFYLEVYPEELDEMRRQLKEDASVTRILIYKLHTL